MAVHVWSPTVLVFTQFLAAHDTFPDLTEKRRAWFGAGVVWLLLALRVDKLVNSEEA